LGEAGLARSAGRAEQHPALLAKWRNEIQIITHKVTGAVTDVRPRERLFLQISGKMALLILSKSVGRGRQLASTNTRTMAR
jgi:hypothetical protein